MKEKKVLATVKGKEITEETVLDYIQRMGPQGRQFNNEQGIQMITNELINQELLYFDALEKGYDQEAAYLEEVERFKEQNLKQFAMQKVFQSVQVTDEEVQAFYDDHKEDFQEGLQFEAAHILVADEDQALEIYQEVKDGQREVFEEQAKKHSSCPSGNNGGGLGRFGQGQMVPEFEAALRELEIGGISQPVKTNFGYHIIRLDDKTEGGIKSFEQVKDMIFQQLTLQKQQDLYVEVTDELEKKVEVKRFF